MNAAESPILITGLGTFGAAGRDCGELWENCRHGCSLAQMRELPDLRLPVYAAPEPALDRADLHRVRNAGRAAALALAAAREAWQHAGLTDAEIDPARIGLIIGSSRGPADVVDASLLHRSKRPSEAVYTAFSSSAGLIASALNIQGCSLAVSATCTSGAAAIYMARQLLRSGEFDLILAGGVDAPLIPSIMERMASTGVLSSSGKSQDALRPFDVDRDGTVLGEGAAFLVLESPASVARRRARVEGTLLAAALSCEPHSRTRPTDDCEGLQRAVRAALAQRSTDAPDIDLIHLHGTGTVVNDLTESRCINALFGGLGRQPPCWSSKAITGHTLGAASSFQAVLSLLAMRHSFLPGTANCSTLDPACALHLSMGKGISKPIRSALCLTSGFWGKNSCLLLGAPEL